MCGTSIIPHLPLALISAQPPSSASVQDLRDTKTAATSASRLPLRIKQNFMAAAGAGTELCLSQLSSLPANEAPSLARDGAAIQAGQPASTKGGGARPAGPAWRCGTGLGLAQGSWSRAGTFPVAVYEAGSCLLPISRAGSCCCPRGQALLLVVLLCSVPARGEPRLRASQPGVLIKEIRETPRSAASTETRRRYK